MPGLGGGRVACSGSMELLRTPDEAFTGIDGFSYPAQYAMTTGGVRIAYVNAGPDDGEPVVLLHGEPTWSFLYRNVIPVLADAGQRIIAPDLVGFGRSDKPADIADHSYARHVAWMRELLFDLLELRGVTIVGHDWGGLIGLRLAAENADVLLDTGQTNSELSTSWKAAMIGPGSL